MKNKKQLTITVTPTVHDALEKECLRIKKDTNLDVTPNQLAACWLIHWGQKLGYPCSTQ
jgi:hypothetical protein